MVDFKEYFEISDDDDITCDLCNKTWDGKYFEALNGVNHLMSAHGIGASYESKASEYDSMGMWDEMEVWWNSLPTSEQRDIIAKRGEGWELDRIDENGWETDFASLTDLQGDIVAPEYRVRNGLPEWSDIGLGTFKESKASLKAMKDLGAGDFAGDIPDDMDLDEWLGESKTSEGYVNIDDDGFYNPIGISDVPSIIGGIAKGYGKKLVKPFQEDKSGDWEIQVKDDNGEWKTYEYGGHYFGKDGADHDAKNLSKVNRVVRKGSGYESKAKESSDVFLYEPANDVDGVGYWWDFELPLDESKERKTFEDLDIQYGKAWGYLTQDEKERVSNYKSKLSESTTYKESWNQANSIKRIEALEKIGIKQGDAIKLSSMEFEDFGEDLQGALKGDVEDARREMKDQVDYLNNSQVKDFDDVKTMGYNWQEGEEVENPNSEFGQSYPDYNNIGESQTNRTKYECEYCDHGFKSNEALMVHHNDKHAISKETLDGYATEDSWASPMINKGQTYSKSLHSDYKYGINDELILICDICGWEAGIVDRDSNDDSVHDKLEEHIASVHNIVRDYWAESYVRKAKYTGNEGLSLAEWSKMQDENGWYRVGVSGATPEIEDTAKAMGGSWHGQGGDGYNVTEWTFHNHSDAENFAQYVEGKSITIDHGTDHADYGLDSRYLPTEQHYVEGPYDASPYVFDSTGSHNIGSGAIGGSPLRDNPFGESRASESFDMHSDAGHGWLEVPKSLLKELGISKDISMMSYQKGNSVFIEEDGDLSTFKIAYEEKYGSLSINELPQTDDDSPIRDYYPYGGESRASEYMSLIGDTPEQYWSMGGLNSIEEDLELYNEDSQNASSYPIYSKPDTTKLWSDLSDQEKSDIQTLFHFMSGGGETDFYDQESYSKASESFVEDDHPRDEGGQFTSGGSGWKTKEKTPYDKKVGKAWIVGSNITGGYTEEEFYDLDEAKAQADKFDGQVTQIFEDDKPMEEDITVYTSDNHDSGFQFIDPMRADQLASEAKEEEHGFTISGNKARCNTCQWIYDKDEDEEWKGLAEHEQDHKTHGNDFVRMVGESKASETKAEIAYWWNDMSPYERENIVDEYGVGHGLYDGDYNKTYDQIENDSGDQFNRAEIDAIFTNHVINKQTGLDRKDLIKDQSDMGLISGQIPSNTWDDTEYDYFYKQDDKIWGESKATERLSYKDAWDNLDTFKREGILMNGSGGNYEYEEDELIYVNHSYDQLPQHITQLVNEYMDYKGHTLEFNDLSEDDKEFLRKQYPDKYGSESKASEAGLEDHSCPECGFITSDNSEYVDHLNAHEE